MSSNTSSAIDPRQHRDTDQHMAALKVPVQSQTDPPLKFND